MTDKMKDVEVSVIMSVFNERGYLEDTINSVLNQTYSNFEFIIIDDGSSVETKSKLNGYQNFDNRIKVITNKNNIGLTKSLHKALHIASGRYIARIDEGDLWKLNKLMIQYNFLIKNQDYVIVGSQINCFPDRNCSNIYNYPTKYEELLTWLWAGKTPLCHTTILFSSGLINYNRTATTSQDFDLYLRLSFFGKMKNIDKSLVDIYVDDKSISGKNSGTQIYNHYYIYREYILAISGKKSINEFIKHGPILKNNNPLINKRKSIAGYWNNKISSVNVSSTLKKILRIFIIPEILFFHFYRHAMILIHRSDFNKIYKKF